MLVSLNHHCCCPKHLPAPQIKMMPTNSPSLFLPKMFVGTPNLNDASQYPAPSICCNAMAPVSEDLNPSLYEWLVAPRLVAECNSFVPISLDLGLPIEFPLDIGIVMVRRCLLDLGRDSPPWCVSGRLLTLPPPLPLPGQIPPPWRGCSGCQVHRHCGWPRGSPLVAGDLPFIKANALNAC